jgi:hypothetical protein
MLLLPRYVQVYSCFSSLSDGKGSKVILEVGEADPEVIRKCACGQWSMGSGQYIRNSVCKNAENSAEFRGIQPNFTVQMPRNSAEVRAFH